MATSDALATVVDLVSGVEHNGGELREVSVTKSDDIVGTVGVTFPVFDETKLPDGLSINVADTGIEDGNAELTLEITLSSDSQPRNQTNSNQDRTKTITDPDQTPVPTQPPYKDRRELEKVYEEFETFPEMTEALGVDVTPETVRRYMIKYDIHDPVAPNQVPNRTQTDSSETNPRSDARRVSEVTDSTPTDVDCTTDNAVRKNEKGADPSVEDSKVASVETQPVVELIENNTTDGSSPVIADGSGIPQSLTVREFADVLERSRTVSETQRSLGLEYDQTRNLLQKLHLIEFVTGRLAASHSKVPSKLVAKRLEEYCAEQ